MSSAPPPASSYPPRSGSSNLCLPSRSTISTNTPPHPGSAVVRILAAPIISYTREIYDGTRKYLYPAPLVPGTSAIGRVAALGSDSTALKLGDLVHVDSVVRSRDNPNDVFLSGVHEGYTDGSRKLMEGRVGE